MSLYFFASCVLTKLFTYLTLVISAATTRCLSSLPAICGTKNKSVTPSWEEGQGCRQEIEEDSSSGPAVVVPPTPNSLHPSHDVGVKVTLVAGDWKCWRRLACFIVSRSCVSFSPTQEEKWLSPVISTLCLPPLTAHSRTSSP